MKQRIVTAFTALLFYSVIGYFSSRVKNICDDTYARPRNNNVYRCYIKWILKIILEWSKALTVVICLREQGMNYQPSTTYTLFTFMYYFSTEKIFLVICQKIIGALKFDVLDTLEHLYVPIVLYSYATVMAAVACVYLHLTTSYQELTACVTYFAVYLRLKDILYNYVRILNLEKRTFASFKPATETEIQEWNDICAVCLNTMSRARITPCNHLFHPQCLKQCLQLSFQCPLCKRDFVTE